MDRECSPRKEGYAARTTERERRNYLRTRSKPFNRSSPFAQSKLGSNRSLGPREKLGPNLRRTHLWLTKALSTPSSRESDASRDRSAARRAEEPESFSFPAEPSARREFRIRIVP